MFTKAILNLLLKTELQQIKKSKIVFNKEIEN